MLTVTASIARPGVVPSALPYRFEPVDPALGRRPDAAVLDPDTRFRAAHPDYAERHLWLDAAWDHYWGRVPVELLEQTFTAEERYRFWYGSQIESVLHRHIVEHDELLAKVDAGLWAYSKIRDYNAFAACFEGLRKLALPGFDLRLVWTPDFRPRGWARQNENVYLDADLGLFVYHRGRHVMTVGFGLGEHVFVTQVQLCDRRRNRWLYELGEHHLDLVLEMFFAAFGDRLALVDGHAAVAAVRASYRGNPCRLTPVDEARIAAFYDRPLRRFTRVANPLTAWELPYWTLMRIQS
jgi:hypothetical protein